MLDMKFIRNNPDDAAIRLMRRGVLVQNIEQLIEADKRSRDAETRLQALQAEANECARNPDASREHGRHLNYKMTGLKGEATGAKDARQFIMDQLPNFPADDTPDGEGEDDNQFVRSGNIKPEIPNAKAHDELFKNSIDGPTGVYLAGSSRFVMLHNKIARLHRALGQFMLDLHVNDGFIECNVPLITQGDAMYGTGQFPKFQNDAYSIDDDKWLIPTSEVPLVNQFSRMKFARDEPIRVTALSQCFRREAGSHGADTKGLLRQHQFEKVEMVSICDASQSAQELEYLTNRACMVLDKLGLHYRVMRLCVGDMGFAAAATYDIEVWMPSQNRYREISSCSNCTDFQARRISLKFNNGLAHTLNGSGLAVGRAMMAVIENYQQSDGSVVIPEVLRPYMGGMEIIEGE